VIYRRLGPFRPGENEGWYPVAAPRLETIPYELLKFVREMVVKVVEVCGASLPGWEDIAVEAPQNPALLPAVGVPLAREQWHVLCEFTRQHLEREGVSEESQLACYQQCEIILRDWSVI
jgi:hypothetical protein